MLGAGEGLEWLDSEAGKGARLDIWDVERREDPVEVNQGCRLGLTVGAGVGEKSPVPKEVRMDLIVIIGVEVGSAVMAGRAEVVE